MDHKDRMTRRKLLATLAASGGLALTYLFRAQGSKALQSIGPEAAANTRLNLPLVIKEAALPSTTPTASATPDATSPSTATTTATSTSTATATATKVPVNSARVVHVYRAQATTWDFSTGWYGDYVDQSIVTEMVDQGVTLLTDTTTRADAWATLLGGYQSGQQVAIKVNLNNAGRSDTDNIIDALSQPVNAVIDGLMAASVPLSAIWIYDVSNGNPSRGGHAGTIPLRFKNGCTSGVNFAARNHEHAELGYSATEKIDFRGPQGLIAQLPVCNALVNAHYLINMPIMKKHGFCGITLGLKNHFGSIDQVDRLHESITFLSGYGFVPDYARTYNPIVELNQHPQIRDKTILTIGDGLYGDKIHNHSVPQRWATFSNNAPNSLFFARDPVAIDCIMADLLDAESAVDDRSFDYLRLASAAGLGVFERGDPHGAGYQVIEYVRV